MSKTLVVIHSYPGASAQVCARWNYYERAGCKILGVGTTDGKTVWPFPAGTRNFVGSVDIGPDKYVSGDHLPMRLIDTFRGCLGSYPQYDDYCVVEWDSIFLGPLPEHSGDLITNAAGFGDGPGGRFKGTRFFHTPWWADKYTADKIVSYGTEMILDGFIEEGFPDRFMGLMVDCYDLQWQQGPFFSVNSIDRPEYVDAARKAIREGFVFCHGLKTMDQIKAVTQNLPHDPVS